MFGYTGQYFVPQVQLGITPSQTIAEAKTISNSVGKANLDLVSVVGEELNQPPWGVTLVNWSNATQVKLLKSYVKSLAKYASGLYARMDFEQFNNTGNGIYTQVKDFVGIGINGFWMDHGPNLYNDIGQVAFNAMMQNLTASFPGIVFMLNEAVKCPPSEPCIGFITPVSGDTWQDNAYVSPSLVSDTSSEPNFNYIQDLNEIPAWNGRVVLHFDAYAQLNTEPMGLFANQTSKEEESIISNLTTTGLNPANSNDFYYTLYPVLGAATYNGTITGGTMNYEGTFYNSLKTGTFSRSTVASFIKDMTAA